VCAGQAEARGGWPMIAAYLSCGWPPVAEVDNLQKVNTALLYLYVCLFSCYSRMSVLVGLPLRALHFSF
jgi:hypothetical protein